MRPTLRMTYSYWYGRSNIETGRSVVAPSRIAVMTFVVFDSAIS